MMCFKNIIMILSIFLFILFLGKLKAEHMNGNGIIADSSGYIEIKKSRTVNDV